MYPNNPKATDPNFAPPVANHHPEGEWTTGLYDCCDDPSNCFATWFCPCIIFGQIAEIIDRGTTSHGLDCLIYYAMGSIHCKCLYAGKYRSKLRELFSLPEVPCPDRLLHCCCGACSLCQEYRELKNRGADPSIGWQANVEKWHREGLKPPIVAPAMER